MGTTTNGGNNNKMINRCYMTAGAYTKYVWGNNSPSARALFPPSLLPLSLSQSLPRRVVRQRHYQAWSVETPLRPHTTYIIIIIIIIGHIQHHHYGGEGWRGGGGRRAATFNIIIGTRLPCKCLLWEFVGRRRVVGIDPPLRPIQLPRPLLPCLT